MYGNRSPYSPLCSSPGNWPPQAPHTPFRLLHTPESLTHTGYGVVLVQVGRDQMTLRKPHKAGGWAAKSPSLGFSRT